MTEQSKKNGPPGKGVKSPQDAPTDNGARQAERLAVVVREMLPGDVDAVAAVEAQGFSDPWPARAFSSLLSRNFTRMRVAELNDEIVGYCVLLMTSDQWEVGNICVSTGVRGRGVGAQLLDEAIAAADSQGAEAVFLEVRESNFPAQRLYEARGFFEVGRRRDYYEHPVEDALVMQRAAPGETRRDGRALSRA